MRILIIKKKKNKKNKMPENLDISKRKRKSEEPKNFDIIGVFLSDYGLTGQDIALQILS